MTESRRSRERVASPTHAADASEAPGNRRCARGDAQQDIPRPPTRAGSAPWVGGLAIVPTNRSRVFAVIAASTLATLVASTKLTPTPNAANELNWLTVFPNRN